MLVAVLCACGKDTTAPDTEPAETPEATEAIAPKDDGNNESAKVSFDGTWYEKVSGRGEMAVTVGDDGVVVFDVKWADSATKTFVWQFSGYESEQGVVKFDNGFKGVIENDDAGNETKTIISEDSEGSAVINADGTMVWTFDGEVNEFVKG